jgi:predicted DNA-binding transcriptional regulator AlpA
VQRSPDTKSGNGKLLTVKKACEIYGLDPTLIYHWIRYKKFDFFKLDKKVLFLESDFLDFLEQHKVNKSEALE